MSRRLHLIVFGLAAPASAAVAHHSIGRVYDGSRQITITGVVSEFQFVNPHPVLVIEVETGDGAPESWRLEMDNRFELVRIGVAADTFAAGDRVEASGSPGRTRAQTLYVRRLTRPSDNLVYEQIGSTPRVSKPSR